MRVPFIFARDRLRAERAVEAVRAANARDEARRLVSLFAHDALRRAQAYASAAGQRARAEVFDAERRAHEAAERERLAAWRERLDVERTEAARRAVERLTAQERAAWHRARAAERLASRSCVPIPRGHVAGWVAHRLDAITAPVSERVIVPVRGAFGDW